MHEVRFSSNGIESDYEGYGEFSSFLDSNSSLKIYVKIYDCRLCDLVVVDPEGRRVIPSMTYSEQTNSTTIDLSPWTLTAGVWKVIPVEVQPDSGLEEEDFFSLIFNLNSKSKFLSRMISSPVLTPNIQDITPLGIHFYASGQEQLVNGQIVERLIPAFGSFRQWVGIGLVSKERNYNFQVFHGSDSHPIFDEIQKSSDFQSDPNNKGEKFYFPENLPAYNSEGVRLEYSWKVRIEEKVNGVMEWSEWSDSFPFKVNVPPTPPTELEVKKKDEE